MFSIGLWTTVTFWCFIYIPIACNAQCWSKNACIDMDVCDAKGGITQAGLCPGANNIRCCSCKTCMDARVCIAEGGVPHAGICSGANNIQCCNMNPTSTPESINGPDDNNLWLIDLADILRNADLDVVEVAGWRTRGHSGMTSVKGILIHHTAGSATGDFPSLTVVRDGRSDLAGPLAQLGLGRTGKWYVIAAGRCYHAGKTIDDSVYGNYNAIGIEAENTGVPSDEIGHTYWPEVQWQSYVRGVRAVQEAYGISTEHVLGHKEAAYPLGRKPDPNFSMDEFREALDA